MQITKKVDYGIFLLTALARKKDKSVSVNSIAKENKIPLSFLQKIAKELLKAKIILAERGKYGGYRLAKKPAKISIKDIIEALEGPIAITQCIRSKKLKCKCSGTCHIKSGIEKINQEIEKAFLSKKLNYFLQNE